MWSGDELDLEAYLARIGYAGQLAPDLDTLRRVHRAHVRTIVFESLDVLLGRPVGLDLKSIQDKLVHGGRGGYCYEQNSLLAAALERIGFRVSGRAARNRTRGALMPVTHALLVVTLDGGPWLCDAGFGHQGPLEPVPLGRAGTDVRQGEWTYRIREEEDGILALCFLREGEWRDLYAFSPQRMYPVDWVLMNHYSSSHPRAAFTRQLIVQRTAESARTALIGDRLTVLPAGGRAPAVRRTVPAGELLPLLDREFGIRLSDRDSVELLRRYPAED
ncbi:arylamine N-acetyltransferase [Streptomyces sp. NPDC048603]|uniref:arylamine N-acetyltransferase family protein n=1 Tax=Streptomyces sp. NPDC048603 TaxID=3365577 RepID=UPI003715B76A